MIKYMSNKTVWVVIVLLVVGVGGYFLLRGGYQAPVTTQPPETTTEVAITENSVTANDQGPGESVTVASVELVDSGYVVVHEDGGGKPGSVIGNSELLSGRNSDVVVSLSRSTLEEEVLYAMLHSDDGDGVYEFPGEDAPLKDDSGVVVLSKFSISEGAAEQGAKEISMSSSNFSFSPKTLTLKEGQPVKITFANSGTHTFTIDELGVNESLSGGSVTVEFTPSKSGTFEYYCAVPGHKERGMIGSLTVN